MKTKSAPLILHHPPNNTAGGLIVKNLASCANGLMF
jgi:hypothetical protein